MKFESEQQRAVYSNVACWMEDLFGDDAIKVADVPVIHFQRGSAVTIVTVYPWREAEAIIEIESELVSDTERSPDLLESLLKHNYRMRFGGFSVDPRGKVVFRHTLLGSTCDRNELMASVRAVSRIADEFDEKIVSRWGGVMPTEDR